MSFDHFLADFGGEFDVARPHHGVESRRHARHQFTR